MHDKLREKLSISTCSFFLINESGWEFVSKKLMVTDSFIEKTYVVGTHWNSLIEAIPMWTYNICYWNKEENYLDINIFQVACPLS